MSKIKKFNLFINFLKYFKKKIKKCKNKNFYYHITNILNIFVIWFFFVVIIDGLVCHEIDKLNAYIDVAHTELNFVQNDRELLWMFENDLLDAKDTIQTIQHISPYYEKDYPSYDKSEVWGYFWYKETPWRDVIEDTIIYSSYIYFGSALIKEIANKN